MSDFPDGFLWGSATSAHQVAGGNTNSDWWEWEHTPGSAAVESSGDGIDHWHRYDEDFALLERKLAEQGQHFGRAIGKRSRASASLLNPLYGPRERPAE